MIPPPGFTQYCQHCNKPMAQCQGHTTPPVSLPTGPNQPQGVVEEARVSEFDWCDRCNFSKLYCKGHVPAAPEPASTLDRRVKDVKR